VIDDEISDYAKSTFEWIASSSNYYYWYSRL